RRRPARRSIEGLQRAGGLFLRELPYRGVLRRRAIEAPLGRPVQAILREADHVMAHDRAVDHLLDLEFPQVRERGSPKTAAVMAPQPDVPEDAREDADRPKDVSGVEPSARHGKL